MITRLRSPRGYVALLLTAIPTALIVLASIGGLTETQLVGIPVVPVYTLFGLPIDLIVRDIAMACTVGFALVGGVLTPRPNPRLGALTSISAAIWLLTLLLQAVLTVSEVLALSAGDSLNLVILQSLLTQTTVGQVILAQFVLVSLIALLGWVVLGRVTGVIVVALAGIAAFLPGLTGHSGIDEGHTSASIALGLHLIFMSAWVGGLIALVWYVMRVTPVLPEVIYKFSVVALISVVVIAESGLLNASMRIDGVAPYLTSAYGSIIMAKVAVLIVLIGFGWRHRQSIAHQSAQDMVRTCRHIAVGEVAWMGVVIGLAVALSRTAPPAFAVVNDPVDFGSLAIMTLAIPVALVYAFPALGERPRTTFVVKYPEAFAVLLVVVMFVVAEFTRTGSFGGVVGVQIAAVLFMVVSVIVGIFFMSSQWGSPSLMALVVIAAGWGTTVYWQLAQRDLELTSGTVFVTVGVLGILSYVFVSARWPRPLTAESPDERVAVEQI